MLNSLEETIPPPPDRAHVEARILVQQQQDRSWLLRAVVSLLFVVVAALLATALFDLAPGEANRSLLDRILTGVLTVASYVVGYYVGRK